MAVAGAAAAAAGAGTAAAAAAASSPAPAGVANTAAANEKDFAFLKSTLGPVIFQLALEQDTIKELFSLLKKVFNVFDTNGNGEIDKHELQALVDLELIDAAAAKRLWAWDTNKDKVIQFAEFAAFFASEFLANTPAVGGTVQPKPVPAATATAAAAAAAAAPAPATTPKPVDPPSKPATPAPGSTAGTAAGAGTVDSKMTPKGKTVGDLQAVPLPRKLQELLPPLIFRVSCREHDLRRIFTLFRRLFGVFDTDADGRVEIRDLNKLVDTDFLGAEEIAELATHAAPGGTLTFAQFMSFWIAHYLDSAPLSKEEESLLSTRLGPIVFKIALEQQNIKELFELLHRLFDVFDVDRSGAIDKREISTLRECELMDERGLTRLLKWDTNKDGHIQFTEFCAFVASEMLRPSVELLSGTQNVPTQPGSPKPLPAKWDRVLPPLLFRLASRQTDMVRIFGLFRRLFDVFDSNGDGRIDKRELRKLVQLEVLHPRDVDTLMKWRTHKADSIVFDEFIAFWIAHAVKDKSVDGYEAKLEAKPTAAAAGAAGAGAAAAGAGAGAGATAAAAGTPPSAAAAAATAAANAAADARTKAIAPLLLRLAAQRDEIARTFDLLKQLFNACDDSKDGYLDKLEIAGLLRDQFLDERSVKKLATFDTDRNGKIGFNEFLAFLADELATGQGKF